MGVLRVGWALVAEERKISSGMRRAKPKRVMSLMGLTSLMV